jgi:hypothetical protein
MREHRTSNEEEIIVDAANRQLEEKWIPRIRHLA